MRIAVDARELVGSVTGAGRYLARLLDHWSVSPAARAHQFTLYAHRAINPGGTALEERVVVLPGAGGTRWEQGTLAAALRREPPDVLFAPAYSAPVSTRVPVVLSVHDVSFAAHPEWFRWREGLRRRLVTGLSARRAALVLTLSEFSRAEIVTHLGVPAGRVRVVPLGLGLRDDAPLTPVDVAPRPPSILFVGSIFNRRHVPALVRALPLVQRHAPDARLVIVGDNRTWPPEDPSALAAELGLAEAVTVTSFVGDDRLRHVYAEASVFAFLSEYEGFGLTPLEALASGVPIVVLDTPVAREVYGPAACYVPTPDPEIVARAIVDLLNPVARARQLEVAATVLVRYRWEDAAAATLAALEEAGRS